VLAPASFLSLLLVVGCAGGASKAADAGVMEGAAGMPGAILPGVPFAGFDAAIPTCMNAPRVADAGAVPQRDCGAGPDVSFANDVQPLLASHCTGEICHETTWAASKTEYADLVNTPTPECCDGRKRVDPVHPDRSYLLQKLRGVDLCAGRRMPLSGSVTEAQIAEIARWICQGARND
jgi:hypothetical protein